MPTPVPPDITVKLYQLEDGGADLQKKVSPAEVSFSTGAVTTNDFSVQSLSDLTESIEIDKGVYQIDGISLTVSGLVETFFNAYSDSLNEPYVCEIYDNNAAAVVFHGPIDRHSCYYNPGTGYTSFDVNSWLYVLEQTSAAARYVYDTKMSRRYDGTWNDVERAVFIFKTINGLDMSTVVQPGDVVVFDHGAGEHRTPVIIPTVDGDDLVLPIVAPPSNLYVVDIASSSVTKGFTNYNQRYIRITISSATLHTALRRFHSNAEDSEYEGKKVNVFISPNGGTHSGETHWRELSSDALQINNLGQEYWGAQYWDVDDEDGSTVIISIETDDEDWVTDAVVNGVDVDVGTTAGTVDTGNKIRILGREVYGYVETGGFAPITAQMKVQKIIEGMFGLTDLGVMQYVTDTFTYPVGWDPEWDKWLEYPNKLVDSLRQIQDTAHIFFKFTTTLDGGLLPRMTLEVIPRVDANVAARGAATAITEIINYKEKAADVIPRAVRVEPSHKYFLPKAWNHVDHLGFYFSGMPTTALAIASSIVPEGADVLKFKANWTPTYTDVKLWPTNGKAVMLDAIGQNIARRFYEFYESLNRNASFLYNGELAVDQIGNFVSINEGGLARTIFVTKISRGIFSKESTIDGLVGEYTESTSSNPVAVIDGEIRYIDTDSGGNEDISLNGQRSYDPDGLALTYEWILDPTGTPSTISTSPLLNAHTLAVGTHVIRLTVDNGTTDDSKDVTIKIVDPEPATTPPSAPEANFQQSPFLTLDASGDVFITVDGDNLIQQASGGVVIDYSLTSSSGPWTPATGTPFTDPVSLGAVLTGLAENTTVWVRARLLNDSDGSTSTNEWISQITNTIGSAVSGDFTIDSPTFHVDSTNNRVGIGTITPGATLEVAGDTMFSNASTSVSVIFEPTGVFADFRFNTSDGSDNKRIRIGAGGDVTANRGAVLELRGNEAASNPGQASLTEGDIGGGILLSAATGGLSLLGDTVITGFTAAASGSGVGLTPTDGTFHVNTASAGAVTADSDTDDLVIENNSHVGIALLSPDISTSQIVFGSPSDSRGASFTWVFTTKIFTFGTNTTSGVLKLQSDNSQDNLILSGIGGSRLAEFQNNATVLGQFNVDGGNIRSITGAISFGNENLTTTGFLQANTGGFGLTRTEGTLHILTSSAGAVAADSDTDDLVIENNSHVGIHLLCANTSTSGLKFGSPTDPAGAGFFWTYATGLFNVGTLSAGAKLVLKSDNDATNLTLAGTGSSRKATFAGSVVIDHGTGGSPWLDFNRSGTREAVIAVAGSAGDWITGSAVGDLLIRVQTKELIFSLDSGATKHVIFSTTGVVTLTNVLQTVAGTTTKASLNIPSGVAKTTPANGDFWSDGSDLLVRLGGTTYTLNKT